MDWGMAVTGLGVLSLAHGVGAAILGIRSVQDDLREPAQRRIDEKAMAMLFGPLREHAGWILISVGIFFGAVGLGLISQPVWARLVVVVGLSSLVMASMIAIAWGGWRGCAVTVVGGVVRVAAFGGLLWWMSRPEPVALMHDSARGLQSGLAKLFTRVRDSRGRTRSPAASSL